jgi:HEAT repeat protein
MKILKDSLMTIIIFYLVGIGFAQGSSDRDSNETIQTSSKTEANVRITTNPFETNNMRKDVKYVASDADIEKWGKWIDDPTLFGREEGVFKLATSNNPKAIPYLLKALRDPESSVRGRPAAQLSKFQDPRIKPALIATLKLEKSLLVQKSLINSIRKLGATVEDEKIIKKYHKSLLKETRKVALSGKNATQKIRAILERVYVLNEEPKQYEDAVIKILESDSSEKDKVSAIRLLGKTHTEKSMAALKRAVKNKNPRISIEAELTLRRTKAVKGDRRLSQNKI